MGVGEAIHMLPTSFPTPRGRRGCKINGFLCQAPEHGTGCDHLIPHRRQLYSQRFPDLMPCSLSWIRFLSPRQTPGLPEWAGHHV